MQTWFAVARVRAVVRAKALTGETLHGGADQTGTLVQGPCVVAYEDPSPTPSNSTELKRPAMGKGDAEPSTPADSTYDKPTPSPLQSRPVRPDRGPPSLNADLEARCLG